MKKDIEIPEIDGIHIVAIKEWDKDFTEKQWNVYIVNNRKEVISTVLVLSRGKSEDRKTSTLRHSLGDIEPNMSAKIEFITTEVLEFTIDILFDFLSKTAFSVKNSIFHPDPFT